MKIKDLAFPLLAVLMTGSAFAANSDPSASFERVLQVHSIYAVNRTNGMPVSAKDSYQSGICQSVYASRFENELVKASYSLLPHNGQAAMVQIGSQTMDLYPAGFGNYGFISDRTPSSIAGASLSANLDVDLVNWRFQLNMPGDVARGYTCIVEATG